MIILNGKYNEAKVFTDNIEESAKEQIIELLNQKFVEGERVRIMPDCLPETTEILTENGFKSIKNVSLDDMVANYNIKSGEIIFCKPKNIIKRPLRESERMYQFYLKKNNSSFITTENHRVLINGEVSLAKDIPLETRIKEYSFSGSSISEKQISHKYTDIELQLICWIVGDGSITDNGCGTIRVKFSFTKERKINRITQLLDGYGIQYNKHKNSRGDTSITVNKESSKRLISLLPGEKKTLPSDFLCLSSHQFEIVKNEIIQVDGDYKAYCNNKGFVYSTTDKNTSDILQAMFCINGYFVVQKEKERNYPNNKVYRLNITESSKLKYNKNGYHNCKIIKSEFDNYNNYVYCIECETSFFIMKQNGLTIITGNCHAGAGCPIGFTSTLTNKIIPSLVGVDIGCGLLMVKLDKRINNMDELDSIIRSNVPSGFNVHENPIPDVCGYFEKHIPTLSCFKPANINLDRALCSLGTLGGGNHFIELDEDDDGNQYLVVHTGSRYLGKQFATYYQDLAYERLTDVSNEKDKIIKSLIEQGRQCEIQNELKKLEKPKVNKNLAYLKGGLFWEYFKDMRMIQDYADLNRGLIIQNILFSLGAHPTYSISTSHNYIDSGGVIRKGAVDASRGKELLIPINMRDGILICEGKGNPDWNYSAPHGAGRICSRVKAKERFSMDEFKSEMDGIYSTCVNENTLDESPMAYKPMDEIIKNIGDTVEIKKVVKPIYNFKAN